MGNEEVVQLREMKEKLLKKVTYLRNRLKDQEENGRQESSINFNITLSSNNEGEESTSVPTKYKAKLCEITGQVTGITFKDVNRKWLRNNVYMYIAEVVTKTVSFNVELTVFFKDLNNFQVENIMCYFIDIHDCYILEISPWFQKVTNMKNFSLLMSAFSDYNENNILRSKILRSLELKKYASTEQYSQENGGILVHMHSPGDTEKSYVIFQWTMKFLELTWRIEHFFTIKSTDLGMGFSEENRSLLKEFCKVGLTKDNLVELWDRLCMVIDTYHARNDIQQN